MYESFLTILTKICVTRNNQSGHSKLSRTVKKWFIARKKNIDLYITNESLLRTDRSGFLQMKRTVYLFSTLIIYRLWRCSCSEHCGRKHIRIQRDRVLRTLICQVWKSRMVSQQNRSAPVGTNRLRRLVSCLWVQSAGLQRQDSGDLGHKVQGTGLT